MSRKPSILIAWICLLLIVGGAVAFYLHLRAQTPSFSEVDEFLKHPPESLGWLPIVEREGSMDSVRRISPHEWLERLGIPFSKEVRARNYSFTTVREPNRRLQVTVYHDDQGIQRVQFGGQTIADSTSFSSTVGEKFPGLRRVFRTMLPCPL